MCTKITEENNTIMKANLYIIGAMPSKTIELPKMYFLKAKSI